MATRPRPLIAGNWKMNGRQADGLTLARALAERAAHEPLAGDLLVCPPATLLFLVAELLVDTPAVEQLSGATVDPVRAVRRLLPRGTASLLPASSLLCSPPRSPPAI